MSEVWEPVSIVEGYEVSSRGRVRRTKPMKGTRAGRILKPCVTNRGYYRIRMYVDGAGTSEYVHRLVASAFIPNPNRLPQVNHIDLDKANNCVENLEWCDNISNHAHGRKAGALAQKLDPEKVSEIRRMYREESMTHREIADRFGIHKSTVQSVVRRTSWRHVA